MASVSMVPATASLSASEISQLLTDVSFSTTVAGKTYTADAISSNGEFIASDPNLAGATAAGPNLQAAENNEITRIDFFA